MIKKSQAWPVWVCVDKQNAQTFLLTLKLIPVHISWSHLPRWHWLHPCSQSEALAVIRLTNQRPGVRSLYCNSSSPHDTIPPGLIKCSIYNCIKTLVWDGSSFLYCSCMTSNNSLRWDYWEILFHLRLSFRESLVIYWAINKFTPWLPGIPSSRVRAWSVFTSIIQSASP